MKPESFKGLMDLVNRLRGPNGCPHDRVLTLDDWASYVGGEVRELVKAIDVQDIGNIREEYGDVLWCLIHIGALAEEQELFTIDESIRGVVDKMHRRHPHVFGDAVANTPEEANALYHKTKEEERREDDG